MELITAEGLANTEVEPDPDRPDVLPSVFVGVADVKDCFLRLIMPEWLGRYFSFPAIQAGLIGLDGRTVDGHTLSSTDLVQPLARALHGIQLVPLLLSGHRRAAVQPVAGAGRAAASKGQGRAACAASEQRGTGSEALRVC